MRKSSPRVKGSIKQHVRRLLLRRIIKNADTGCWEWTGCIGSRGYGCLAINCLEFDSFNGTYGAHRLSAFVFKNFDFANSSLFVCHSCDNKRCVNPRHLFVGTPSGNSKDAVLKGRMLKGEDHHCAKLKEKDVFKIRELYKTGDYSANDLAKKFGVSHVAVRNIVLGRVWRHLHDGSRIIRNSTDYRRRSNLTVDDIREIRRLYALGGFSERMLAVKFSVSDSNIHCILSRKTWSDV